MKNQIEAKQSKYGLNDRDQIAKKAYGIWLSEGCPTGHAAEHWRKAEMTLTQESITKDTGETSAPGTKQVLDSRTVLTAQARTKNLANA